MRGAGDYMFDSEGHRLRHEFKYHLNFMEYQLLRRQLATVLKLDPHAGPEGKYHIRSLYFDDFRNSAFFDKVGGVPLRKKYRMRIYDFSDDFIKFERKSKFNEYVCKEITVLNREEAERIINGDIAFLATSDNQLLRCFYLESRRNLMRPVVLVDYLREAYVHPVGNTRITFDIGLRTALGPVSFFEASSSTVSVSDEPGVILEVKFDDVLPDIVRGVFSNGTLPRMSIGKFFMCRASPSVLL